MTEDTAIAPAAELETHHDLTPPEKSRDREQLAWMIKTRIATLHERGAIDTADVQSCKRFRDDWECGIEGAHESRPARPRVDCDDGGLSYLDHQVDALARLRAAKDLLGEMTFGLLSCVVVHDLSWPRVAVAIGVSKEDTAKARGVAAIKALTEFWITFDRRPAQGA